MKERVSKEDCKMHSLVKFWITWFDKEDIPLKKRYFHFYMWMKSNWNNLRKCCIKCCKILWNQSNKMKECWNIEKDQNKEVNFLTLCQY